MGLGVLWSINVLLRECGSLMSTCRIVLVSSKLFGRSVREDLQSILGWYLVLSRFKRKYWSNNRQMSGRILTFHSSSCLALSTLRDWLAVGALTIAPFVLAAPAGVLGLHQPVLMRPWVWNCRLHNYIIINNKTLSLAPLVFVLVIGCGYDRRCTVRLSWSITCNSRGIIAITVFCLWYNAVSMVN